MSADPRSPEWPSRWTQYTNPGTPTSGSCSSRDRSPIGRGTRGGSSLRLRCRKSTGCPRWRATRASGPKSRAWRLAWALSNRPEQWGRGRPWSRAPARAQADPYGEEWESVARRACAESFWPTVWGRDLSQRGGRSGCVLVGVGPRTERAEQKQAEAQYLRDDSSTAGQT